MHFDIDVVVYCCWIALAILWVAGAFVSKPTQRSQPLGERTAYTILAIVGGLFFSGTVLHGTWLNAYFVPHTHSFRLAGLVCTLAGTLFAAWARISLGSNWSGRATVKAGHELITRGPYALVRHPIYTGILLVLAGAVLLHGRWHSLFGFAIVVGALLVKMSHEERLMTETFPRQYPEYRRRVKALIPFVV